MKAFVIGLSIMMAAAGSRGNAGSGTCAAGAGIYAAGFDAGRLAGFVPAGRDGVTQVGEPDWGDERGDRVPCRWRKHGSERDG